MPITHNASGGRIAGQIQERIERLRLALVRQLLYVGEECVNAARDHTRKGKDYTDRTGNLRASTGYVLVVDGAVTGSGGFGPVGTSTDGPDSGRTLAEKVARTYPEGIALIVVAGKSYATYVHRRGYDVLTSAELTARSLVPEVLRKLGLGQ